MAQTSVKIHAFLAQTGGWSRRVAEGLVEAKRVSVNQRTAFVGQRIDPEVDKVKVDGKAISNLPSEKKYILMNKPVGYVSSTTKQDKHSSVMALLPKFKERLYPVGRLDLDAEGLLFITNDGDIAYKLSHPKFGWEKTYHVLVEGRPTTLAIDHLRRGVRLKEGYTQPAKVKILGHEGEYTWLEITIHEGRHHQVKRMTERVGYETLKLVRVKFGPFSMKSLKGKQWLEIPKPVLK